jgi:hypothetical protein
MPRTIHQILDHAAELAKKFENSDPKDGIECPVEEYLAARRSRFGGATSTVARPSAGDNV